MVVTATRGYVSEMREHVGSSPIIVVCGCTAILKEDRRVLLQQRADPDRPWGLPGGSMELGETPGATAIRETKEETGLDINLCGLLGIYTVKGYRYPNGDVVQSVDVVFLAEVTGGVLEPDESETLDLQWFDLDDLPATIFAPHVPMLADLAAGQRGEWRRSA